LIDTSTGQELLHASAEKPAASRKAHPKESITFVNVNLISHGYSNGAFHKTLFFFPPN
jgi:hypothetical protein